MSAPTSSKVPASYRGGFEWLLARMLRRAIRRGQLHIRFPSGRQESFGDGTSPRLGLYLTDSDAVRAAYLDPALGLPELYMDGRLVIESGELEDFVALGKVNGMRGFATPPAIAVQAVRWLDRLWRRHLARETAQRNVAHHYDLDERLFRLFLDEDLQYSCAYFADADMTLEEAQRAKKRHIAAKLMLSPGQSVLDIGCGWGGMALYLARNCQVQVTGITLAGEQLRVARQRAEASQLNERVRFELQDYRQVSGSFDRLVSVGMFEHVGPQNYDRFFATAARLMKQDGVFLLHSIVRARPNRLDPPFIQKYIFPNGHIPALSEVIPAIERNRLLVKDIEILTYHYADTLRAWRQRFHANREAVLALSDERFFRMWDLYLATSEASFRHGRMANFQIQLVKEHAVSRRTRDYIGEAEAALAAIDQQ